MLVLAAACAEGLGSAEFAEMATSYSSPREFLESIRTQPVRIDQWQLEECARIAQEMDVVLVAEGIPAGHEGRLFIRTAPTVAAAVAEGLGRYGDGATIAVVPKGPYTLLGVRSPMPG